MGLRATGSRPTTCSSREAPSRLIVNDHQRVADWCEARIEHFAGWGSNPKAIGWENTGEITAGVVYTNYSPGNVFASIACDAPLTRKFLYAIFYNPFISWGCRHIGSMIEESNVKSINLCARMGFSQEGRLRESAVNGEDVIVMGLTRKECRFLTWGPK